MSDINLLRVSKKIGNNTARLSTALSLTSEKLICLSARQTLQTPYAAKPKRNSLQHTEPSSLTSLDEGINLNVADPSTRSQRTNRSAKKAKIEHFPKIMVTNSMGLTKTVLNTSLSTLNTLKDNSTDTKTSLEKNQTLNFDDEDDVFLDLPDQIVLTPGSQNQTGFSINKSLQDISQGFHDIMADYENMSEGLETIHRKTNRGARRYVKSMQFLNEQLNDPPKKFDFWKENEQFVTQREKAKQEVQQFCEKVEKENKIKKTLQTIQPDLIPDPWIEEDEEFTRIEKIILTKPRPTPKKRLLSREAQINARHGFVDQILKEANINQKPDRKAQKRMSLNFTPGDIKQLNPEQTIFDLLNSRQTTSTANSSKPKLIGNQLYIENQKMSTRRVSAFLPTEPFEIEEEDSGLSSSPGSSQMNPTAPSNLQNKVKNNRVYFERPQKEVLKRYCRPIPVGEQKLKSSELTYDFSQYKKVSISKRSEQITQLRESKR